MSEAVERLAAALHNSRDDIPFEMYTYRRDVLEEARTILAADPQLAEAIELGLAWQAAEAVTPEDEAIHGPWQTANGRWWVDVRVLHAEGATPAAALRAIAAKLTERPKP